MFLVDLGSDFAIFGCWSLMSLTPIFLPGIYFVVGLCTSEFAARVLDDWPGRRIHVLFSFHRLILIASSHSYCGKMFYCLKAMPTLFMLYFDASGIFTLRARCVLVLFHRIIVADNLGSD
jgi:hypothetical protein